MSARHGEPLRGLMSSKRSPLFEGVFGRMFRPLRPATFGATEDETIANLGQLADQMTAGFDEPFDGKDPEESGIPALYTYLGQFIDHDLTFDPASSLQKLNDPDALHDFRTPAFDLDDVYGRGPDDQPYLYDRPPDKPAMFLLGGPISGGTTAASDLPRNSATPARALIGDPRNDENVIVSQLHGLFLRFHNRLVAENPALSFADAQRLLRFHYQYVVVNDFLPRIVHSKVISALKTNGQYDKGRLRFYHFRNLPFMPVEFSAAAYRLGHSMVRPGYRLNDRDETLLPIFPVPGEGLPEGLTGFRAMNPNWGIDWGRFIDIDTRGYDGPDDVKKKRLQFAYRIDTSAVNPLGNLPASVATDPSSLPLRNLLRGWRLGLPNGQSVARAMGVSPLKDSEILLGKFTDPEPTGEEAPVPIANVSPAFAHNCPLWTYILAESRANQEMVKLPVTEAVTLKTPKLGPVGGRIVAEVFLGIMFGDSHSFLSQEPDWHPAAGVNYTLKDFVKYALGL
jgi:Animal haem peroxidase